MYSATPQRHPPALPRYGGAGAAVRRCPRSARAEGGRPDATRRRGVRSARPRRSTAAQAARAPRQIYTQP
eukprot:7233548-Prymnesium_polylepis.1